MFFPLLYCTLEQSASSLECSFLLLSPSRIGMEIPPPKGHRTPFMIACLYNVVPCCTVWLSLQVARSYFDLQELEDGRPLFPLEAICECTLLEFKWQLGHRATAETR